MLKILVVQAMISPTPQPAPQLSMLSPNLVISVYGIGVAAVPAICVSVFLAITKNLV